MGCVAAGVGDYLAAGAEGCVQRSVGGVAGDDQVAMGTAVGVTGDHDCAVRLYEEDCGSVIGAEVSNGFAVVGEGAIKRSIRVVAGHCQVLIGLVRAAGGEEFPVGQSSNIGDFARREAGEWSGQFAADTK